MSAPAGDAPHIADAHARYWREARFHARVVAVAARSGTSRRDVAELLAINDEVSPTCPVCDQVEVRAMELATALLERQAVARRYLSWPVP